MNERKPGAAPMDLGVIASYAPRPLARVAELANAPDLGSGGATLESSSLSSCTEQELQENLIGCAEGASEGDSEIYDSIYETPRMALVAALTDAVRDLLAEGDVTAARVALKTLEDIAALAPPNGNVTSIDERRKREPR